MKSWKGRTEDGTFAVEVRASVLRALDRYCCEADPVETGGILIGSYSDDFKLAIVREATPPPPDSKRGRAWFVRGVSGLRAMLEKRWRAKDRTFYIGEWHYHPASRLEPSSDDFAQMLKISRDREYECKEPLMLILGKPTGTTKSRPVQAFVFASGLPMELNPEPGGPLCVGPYTDYAM